MMLGKIIVSASWREIKTSLTWTNRGDYKRHGQQPLLGGNGDEATQDIIVAPQTTNNRKPFLSRRGNIFQNRGSVGRTKSGGRFCRPRRPEWGINKVGNGRTRTPFSQSFPPAPVLLLDQKPENRED